MTQLLLAQVLHPASTSLKGIELLKPPSLEMVVV